MMNMKTSSSVAAAAALFAMASLGASGVAVAKSKMAEKVHCYGVNSCKGTSDCKSAGHECKGMNDCKGHGFKDMKAKACTKAGGTTTPPAM